MRERKRWKERGGSERVDRQRMVPTYLKLTLPCRNIVHGCRGRRRSVTGYWNKK